MKVNDDLRSTIELVESGKLTSLLGKLEGKNFGIFIPTHDDGSQIRLREKGESQNESDLEITVGMRSDGFTPRSFPVGWIEDFNPVGDCRQHGGNTCNHCVGSHSAGPQNCKTHPTDSLNFEDIAAPEINYRDEVMQMEGYRDILKELSKNGLGISLIHAHSKEYMFTELPIGTISVISGGRTRFRSAQDVEQDETFVPNTWRLLNGKLIVAGGHSQI